MKENRVIKVKSDDKLLEFILKNAEDLPRKKIKFMLTKKFIFVNGRAVSKFDFRLYKNDEVTLDLLGSLNLLGTYNIDLIYENKDLIVINKPSGMLSIENNNSNLITAYRIMMTYTKLSNSQNRIFIVHRLDKDTSGVLIFAKNERIKFKLQENWNENVKIRGYYAVVEGKLKEKEGRIISFLNEADKQYVFSTNDKSGKKAITDYRVISENNNYSLVDVDIKTGRKNQIRVHLKELGHPIVKDKKYGSKDKGLKRLGLHAYKLSFIHPDTKKTLTFTTPVPKEFIKISK
ncbi:MAG: RluA family pseudouridine synthase [Bacilli bacterium]